MIPVNNIQQRHAIEGKFRVIAVQIDHSKAWIEGDYDTFKAAKEVIDKIALVGVDYYVHSNSSRVLYSKKGVLDA